MVDSTVYLLVHGVVQGVGYRQLVRMMASRRGIRGFVRNEDDGSVSIVAIGTDELISLFIKDIDVDLPAGPSVVNIEKVLSDPRFPKIKKGAEPSGFIVLE